MNDLEKAIEKARLKRLAQRDTDNKSRDIRSRSISMADIRAVDIQPEGADKGGNHRHEIRRRSNEYRRAINGGNNSGYNPANVDTNSNFDATNVNADGNLNYEVANVNADGNLNYEAANVNADGNLNYEAANEKADRNLNYEAANEKADRNSKYEAANEKADRNSKYEAANVKADRNSRYDATNVKADLNSRYDAKNVNDDRYSRYDAININADRYSNYDAININADRYSKFDATDGDGYSETNAIDGVSYAQHDATDRDSYSRHDAMNGDSNSRHNATDGDSHSNYNTTNSLPNVVSKNMSVCELPLEEMESAGFITPTLEKGKLTEEYRRIKRPLLKNMRKEVITNGLKNVIAVTSSISGEGKTYSAVNLAMSMALEQDLTVLLLDADVVKGAAGRLFSISRDQPGLTDVLSDDSIDVADVTMKTNVDNLCFISGGEMKSNTNELLASDLMNDLIVGLAKRYEDRIIIMDCPPILQTNEANILVDHAGQVVFVVAEQETRQKLVLNAINQIDKEKYVGVLVNKSSSRIGNYDYYGYYGYK